MIIGNISKFAIESCIVTSYNSLSQRALGSFILHINGISYGVRDSKATLLGGAFQDAQERIARRGEHVIPFKDSGDAGQVALRLYQLNYRSNSDDVDAYLTAIIRDRRLFWEGDEAFDDGSMIIQLDYDQFVRVIGFRVSLAGEHIEVNSCSEAVLEADFFYGVLENWARSFELEWTRSVKA